MTMIKSYVKEALARITGDTAKVIAEKNHRKAVASVRGQIAALNAKLIDDETAVETAQENLKNAKYPKDIISNGQGFIENITDRQYELANRLEDLRETKEAIAFQEELLREFEAEVAE